MRAQAWGAMAVTVLVFVACGPRELRVPSGAYPHPYFTVRPPQEPGWMLRSRSDARAAFERKGAAPDEHYLAFAGVAALPALTTEAEFQDYVKRQMERDNDPAKYKNREQSVEPDPDRGPFCVRTRFRAEGYPPKESKARVGFILIEKRSFFCRHPAYATLLGGGVYQRMHYPQDADPAFEAKAEAFLKGVILHE